MLDFILNGRVYGSVAEKLVAAGGDIRVLRPFIGQDGRTYITANRGGKLIAHPVTNVATTLRKEDWVKLDAAVVAAAKPRLRAVADIRGAGLTYGISEGMGVTVLQTETMTDINDAIISMDGLRESPDDRPEFDLTNLPLPIIHKDFHFSARQIMASRRGGSPLDTTTAAAAGRKVAEIAEKLLLGTLSTYTFGGGVIYGLTNFTSRITRSLTLPTDSAWTPATLLAEILLMKKDSQDAYHYGPWMLYFSSAWDNYLDNDFSANYPNLTLRERIRKIEDIQDARTLDYLPTATYDVVLVQMTSDVIREVVGMDITTVQWATHGDLKLNFKVMAILVPQPRADSNGNTGIVHGTAT
jgi:uncharacterized linocin/CFP29 family protein